MNRKSRGRTPRKGLRAAFSLMEILVALAIVAVLTATLVVNLGSFQRKTRIAHMVETLENLTQALREYDRQLGRYPANLLDLSRKPGPTDDDICLQDYTVAVTNKWKGPYVDRAMPALGIPIETDTISIELERDPASSSSPGQVAQIQIFVRNIPQDIAVEIQADLDGDGTLTDGEIQWNTSPGFPRMIYSMPISGC